MHVPLGLALTETIAETQIPTIAHNHDFYWERVRFSVNSVNDYLRMALPPKLDNIKHVVINSEAQEQLALRTGISSIIIPNVLDFENPPVMDIKAARVFRESIGLKPDDRMILQPTRIIQRNGFLSRKTVRSVKEIMESTERREKMVNYNYEVAARHYSYSVLRTRLNAIMNYFFGDSVKQLYGKAPFMKNKDYLHIIPHQTLHRHYVSKSCGTSET